MHLPHVVSFIRHPIYFFTACTEARCQLLACEESFVCLRKIWERSAEIDGWFVGRFILMPDHLHLFASPAPDAKARAQWLKSWKSLSSRQLVKVFGIEPPIWQADTFDHILRSAESYGHKWNYVRENPVKAKLVSQADDWPWQGEIFSLEF